MHRAATIEKMGSLALLASTLCYLFCFGRTFLALGAGRFQPGRFQITTMALGAAGQSWWLWMRGEQLHACPITTLRETLIFLGCAMALFYLVIGPAYRLSLMGAFTAPLVLLLQVVAILLPGGQGRAHAPFHPWVEAHAALSLVAYGAFGLAGVAGLMFLLQEKQLKSRRPAEIFRHLPPINMLSQAILRLVGTGFLLLSVGFAAGWLAHLPVPGAKWWFSFLIWVLYAALLAGARTGMLGSHRKAAAAAGIFLLVLLLLPWIQHLSTAASRSTP